MLKREEPSVREDAAQLHLGLCQLLPDGGALKVGIAVVTRQALAGGKTIPSHVFELAVCI